eukprot:12056129-Alexandrium_andersonii.AAC.1
MRQGHRGVLLPAPPLRQALEALWLPAYDGSRNGQAAGRRRHQRRSPVHLGPVAQRLAATKGCTPGGGGAAL